MLILRLPKRVDNTDGRGQEIHLLLPLSEGILVRENNSSIFLHLQLTFVTTATTSGGVFLHSHREILAYFGFLLRICALFGALLQG